MIQAQFKSLIAEVTGPIAGRTLDAELQSDLNRDFPASGHHSPTVSKGSALILYLLPQGAIEFTQ